MNDHQSSPEDLPNNTASQNPDSEHIPQRTKSAQNYDYSRSTSSNHSHWYGLPGQSYPLNTQTKTALSQNPSPTTTARTTRIKNGTPEKNSRVRHRVTDRQRRQKLGIPDQWALWIIGGTLVGLIIVVAIFLVFLFNSNDSQVSSAVQPTLPPPIYAANSEVGDDPFPTPAFNPLDIVAWDGKERFTLVVMGLDNRPDEIGSCLSDTLMVISIDPITNRIGILSIPRDIYVDVPPNFGLHQVNQVCSIGNLYLGNGPQLVMQTIQYNFGIRVHDYLMLDFFTFIKFIDRIGGVDIYVDQTINDPEYPDMYYGYDPFYLEAGLQHLDGETALKYTRSRHASAGGDLDRAERQQKLMLAVREKVLNLDMIDNLLIQAPSIWDDLEAGIDTGLDFEQIIELILFARNISTENVLAGVVGSEYVMGYQTDTGWELVPRYDTLVPLMIEVFGEGYNQ